MMKFFIIAIIFSRAHLFSTVKRCIIPRPMKNSLFVVDWFLRFVKGMAIGMDVVLPGVSGAALAVVFGLYERIVQFLARISDVARVAAGFLRHRSVAKMFRDPVMLVFFANILFFIPVGCGALVGIWLVSHPIKFLLENYQTPFYWFFVGAILGTAPQLWKKSGEKGRKPPHIAMLAATFVVASFVFLALSPDSGVFSMGGESLVRLSLNPLVAFGAGAMVALVAFIPGFSSSTFLVMLGLYEPLNAGIKELDVSILAPFGLGLAVFVFPFSKGIEWLLNKTFTGFFHVIMGFVLASAVLIGAIASHGYEYVGAGIFTCAATFVCGAVFSYWMCKKSAA